LVTGSYDATVRLWDLKSNSYEPIQILQDAKDSVASVDISTSEIITGSVDGCVRNYDIRRGKLFTDHIGHPITSVNLSRDRNCILASCLDSTLRLLDKSSGELLSAYRGHKNIEYKIDSCFNNNDAVIISGSEDNNVYFWDLVEANLVQTLKGHTGTVCSLSYHLTEPYLLSSSMDGTIKVWQA